jgi:UDP-N-acetylmuramyl pentapeptide phosphotransferase/UDP-N-acetylglucosamine-1-phosphate transferase
MQDPTLFAWVAVVAGSAALCAGLIVLLKPLLVRYVLAHPNARSSHSEVTPQGAGIAVVLALLIVCGLAGVFRRPEAQPSLLVVLGAAIFLMVLGLLDDARALSVWWRFAGQIAAALAIIFVLPDSFRLLPEWFPFWVERALMVFGTVWLVNAFNFLDGLDWMALAQVVPMTLGIAVMQALGIVPPHIGLLALALLGAMLGFAWFNKHPAQIFLGDAGSLPIGLLLAFMLIYVAEAHLVSALLLSLYTLADATLTLFRRIIDKEPILSAHRTHFYQRAVAQGLRVPQVTARVFLLGLLLMVLAVAAAVAGSLPMDLFCLGLGLLATGLGLHLLARGR